MSPDAKPIDCQCYLGRKFNIKPKIIYVDLFQVSPIKLVRNKNKENQYTPEKRIAIDRRRPDTVEKLSWKVSDLTVRTPQRSAFTEIMPNNKDIPQTPKSTNVNTVDTTTTTR